MLRQHQHCLLIPTTGQGLVEITTSVVQALQSASLVIQENADPDVRGDPERFFARLVGDGELLFVHRSEGPVTCRRMCELIAPRPSYPFQ